MAVGFPTEKSSVDSSVGNLARQIETWAARVPEFKAWLDTQTDEVLQAAPYNYSPEDVALLKSATNDMAALADVYLGNAEHTPASDMSVFVKRVAGIPAVLV